MYNSHPLFWENIWHGKEAHVQMFSNSPSSLLPDKDGEGDRPAIGILIHRAKEKQLLLSCRLSILLWCCLTSLELLHAQHQASTLRLISWNYSRVLWTLLNHFEIFYMLGCSLRIITVPQGHGALLFVLKQYRKTSFSPQQGAWSCKSKNKLDVLIIT